MVNEADLAGLKINSNKAKYMNIKTNQQSTSNRVNFNSVVYEGVDNFKYLGSCLNDPESYAGGGIAARRVTHAGQVKGGKPDEKVHWSKE